MCFKCGRAKHFMKGQQMKNLLKLSAITLALTSASAFADPLSIDPNYDGDTSNNTGLFEQMDTNPFDASSYYVDADGDGTVSTGEFVFDFGLNIQISALEPLLVSEYSGFNSSWGLVADYLIYGEAVVSEDPFNILGGGYTANGEYDNFGAIIPSVPLPAETLNANIVDGMINLFIDTDLDGDGDILAASYDVSSVNPDPFGIQLSMAANGIWALDDFWYNSAGEELNDLVAGGAGWTGLLEATVDAGSSPLAAVPGTYTMNDPGNPDDFTVDGLGLNYFEQNATQITAAANDCPDGEFGFCGGSNASIPFDPVTLKWRDIRDTIRDASKDDQDNNYGILARQTQLDAHFSQTVPEPTSLAILGLGLLGLAGARRKKA